MQDPNKVIFNFSKYELFDFELFDCKNRFLLKDLNFSLPPRYLDDADCLVNFKLFYKNIRNLGILSNEDIGFVKNKQTREAALSSYQNYKNNVKEGSLFSYQNYKNNVPNYFSKEEFLALQNLRKSKTIVVEKSD